MTDKEGILIFVEGPSDKVFFRSLSVFSRKFSNQKF